MGWHLCYNCLACLQDCALKWNHPTPPRTLDMTLQYILISRAVSSYERWNVRVISKVSVSVGLLTSWCYCDGLVLRGAGLVQKQTDIAASLLFGGNNLFLFQNCCFLFLSLHSTTFLAACAEVGFCFGQFEQEVTCGLRPLHGTAVR